MGYLQTVILVCIIKCFLEIVSASDHYEFGRAKVRNKSKEFEITLKAICKPYYEPFCFHDKEKYGNYFYPSCIQLRRCKTCDYNPAFSCNPIVIHNITFKAVVSNPKWVPRAVGGPVNVNQQPHSVIADVMVQDHVECMYHVG